MLQSDGPVFNQLTLHSQLMHDLCALAVVPRLCLHLTQLCAITMNQLQTCLQHLISLIDFSTCSLNLSNAYIFLGHLFDYCITVPCLLLLSLQVCDSDTVLDPACTIEMLKILEEDPMVGAVGGDVQVYTKEMTSIMMTQNTNVWLESQLTNFGGD